jgi:hypothetical protein
MFDQNKLSAIGQDAQDTLVLVGDNAESTSKTLSPAQKAYQDFFNGQLAEHGFENSPFEGNEKQIKEFFNNIQQRWPKRKQELIDEGVIKED